MVQIPDMLADEFHVIDAGVARHFFHTEHCDPATAQRIERAIAELDQALRRPDIRVCLKNDGLSLAD